MDIKTGLWVLLGLLLSLISAWAIYLYKSPVKNYYRYLLAFLRAVSLFGIFLLLINPGISVKTYENHKPKAIILFDNSASMLQEGKKEDLMKIRSKILGNQKFNQKYELRLFSFGEDISNKDSLLFNKKFTNISEPVLKLNKTFEKDAGFFILLTDGNQNQGTNYEHLPSSKQIFPVVLGDTLKKKDFSITRVNSNKYSYVDHTFPVEVFINYHGWGSVSADIEIWEKSSLLKRERLTLDEDNVFKKLEFQIKAETTGNHFYTVKLGSFEGEENRINNNFNFSVQVLDDKAGILLLYDQLHPDIGFWQRMATMDKRRDIEIRHISDFNSEIADYSFVIIMHPNPKFERIMRLLGDKPLNYIVQAGGSTDWTFLNRIQPYLESSNTESTPQALISEDDDFTYFNTSPLNFDKFPPLSNIKDGIKLKQKHQSLWETTNEAEQQVFLFFENEKGRNVFLLAENIYRWQLFDQHLHGSDLQIKNYFNSILQFLSSEKNRNQLEINYKPMYYANEDVLISAVLNDANYQFDPDQTLFLTLKRDGKTVGNKLPMVLKDNSYEIALPDVQPTAYDFLIDVEKMDVHGQGSFQVLDFTLEDQDLSANTAGLRQLAYNSKGKEYYPTNMDQLINDLVEDQAYKTIQKEIISKKTLIDLKWLFFIIVVSLSAEWFLRKSKGLL